MHCDDGTNALAGSSAQAGPSARPATPTQIRTIRNRMILRAFSAGGPSLYCRASNPQCGAQDVVRFSHLATALTALHVSAVAFAQAPAPRAVFTAACAACHGDDGRGRSSSELGFDTPLPDFTDCDFAARETNADWHTIVHRGGPVRGFDQMMPAFGEALEPDEIEAALAQIRSFCTDARWPRGELNFPRAMFTEKAYPEDEAVITTTMIGE